MYVFHFFYICSRWGGVARLLSNFAQHSTLFNAREQFTGLCFRFRTSARSSGQQLCHWRWRKPKRSAWFGGLDLVRWIQPLFHNVSPPKENWHENIGIIIWPSLKMRTKTKRGSLRSDAITRPEDNEWDWIRKPRLACVQGSELSQTISLQFSLKSWGKGRLSMRNNDSSQVIHFVHKSVKPWEIDFMGNSCKRSEVEILSSRPRDGDIVAIFTACCIGTDELCGEAS